ncbi:MAG TPA: hypothetical protein VF469_15385 [Kofleriaceae bacterium]
MYPRQQQRLEAIRVATIEKLAAHRADLEVLGDEERVARLLDEAMTEFYDDPVTANYEAEYVERIVRRAVAAAAGSTG